jgi:hypothetical protein
LSIHSVIEEFSGENAILDVRDLLGALAEATMDLIVLRPAKTRKYRNGGFEIDWVGIARR